MIKDIVDTSRLSLNSDGLNFKVISYRFWNNYRASKDLPCSILGNVDDAKQKYSKLKPNRHLRINPFLGQVDLTLHVGKECFQLSVLPIQAIVLKSIEMQKLQKFTAGEISLDIDKELVEGAIDFWVKKGFIKAIEKDLYEIVIDENEIAKEKVFSEAEHTAEPEASSVNLDIYWSFIVGMLTNLGELPIDRIQSMLCLFVQTPKKYECSVEELKTFLDLLVSQEKLFFKKGLYTLQK